MTHTLCLQRTFKIQRREIDLSIQRIMEQVISNSLTVFRQSFEMDLPTLNMHIKIHASVLLKSAKNVRQNSLYFS